MKLICIGRNYNAHAKELKNEVPKEPLFFMKPQTALLPKKHPFIHPNFTKNLQFEVEFLIKINRLGKHIDIQFAHKYYKEIGLGIDFTARDLQETCKKNGHPWEIAKAFDHSAVTSHFIDVSTFSNLNDITFSLHQNGTLKQKGNTGNMIFKIDEIISYVSKFITLKIGDIIFTGTPSGVEKVNIGDKLECFIEESKMIDIDIK